MHAHGMQVSGVMMTREDFMLSIYDFMEADARDKAERAAAEAALAALDGLFAEQQEANQAAADAAVGGGGAEQHEAQEAPADDGGTAEHHEGPIRTAQGSSAEPSDDAVQSGCRPGLAGGDAAGLLSGFTGWRDLSGWYVAAPGWGLAALLLLRAGWGAQ